MDIKRYKVLERSLGWLLFVLSSAVYFVTMEKSASVWDCPEFITTFA